MSDATKLHLELAKNRINDLRSNIFFFLLLGIITMIIGTVLHLLGFTTGLTFHPWFNNPMPFSLIISMLYCLGLKSP